MAAAQGLRCPTSPRRQRQPSAQLLLRAGLRICASQTWSFQMARPPRHASRAPATAAAAGTACVCWSHPRRVQQHRHLGARLQGGQQQRCRPAAAGAAASRPRQQLHCPQRQLRAAAAPPAPAAAAAAQGGRVSTSTSPASASPSESCLARSGLLARAASNSSSASTYSWFSSSSWLWGRGGVCLGGGCTCGQWVSGAQRRMCVWVSQIGGVCVCECVTDCV